MPFTSIRRVEHPIRALLFARRISRRQLAEATGYSADYVEQSVSGRIRVSGEFAKRAADYLGVPEEQLFAGADDEVA
jgi:transcriptional regulator with XRE-family HTH domain